MIEICVCSSMPKSNKAMSITKHTRGLFCTRQRVIMCYVVSVSYRGSVSTGRFHHDGNSSTRHITPYVRIEHYGNV